MTGDEIRREVRYRGWTDEMIAQHLQKAGVAVTRRMVTAVLLRRTPGRGAKGQHVRHQIAQILGQPEDQVFGDKAA